MSQPAIRARRAARRSFSSIRRRSASSSGVPWLVRSRQGSGR